MSGARAALTFLTRLPARATLDDAGDLARAVPWFPAVGAAVGLACAGSYAIGLLVLPPLLAAVVAVGAGMALTGALHEDGLADFADSFGGRNRDDALRILKDPSHGTYGVLALVLGVTLRVAAISALGGVAAATAFPAAHALGRAGAVGVLAALPPVAAGGLGANYRAAVTPQHVAAAIVSGAAIGAVALGAWVIPALVVVAVGAVVVGVAAARRLGGMTGDVLGAVEQVGEVLVLVLAASISS